MKNMKTFKKSRGGFTLIEMLVVILILAILASLIIPNLVNKASQAKVAKAKSDIAVLQGLLQQFRLDNDRYPTTDEGLNALRVKPSNCPNWKGPYTDKVQLDPWGNEYVYQCPGPSGQDYLITSYGADGAPGGEGDAADITSDQ
jgi:general secretion pathway protein G